MPNLYTITAVNCAFWQDLAVKADTPEEAAEMFRAYLAEPAQIAAEEEEFEMGREWADGVNESKLEDEEEPITVRRRDYAYVFKDKDIRQEEDGAVARYSGPLEPGVVMTGSGGNG